KKLPKKKVRVIKKKPIAVFGIVAAVAIAGIIGGITIFLYSPEEKIIYISFTDLAAAQSGIDPLITWVPADYEILNQVAEGLFTHDSANQQSQIIHNLAINHWRNDNATEYTFELRQGVQFHDGTPFNAAVVQWNIDRIYTLIENGKMHFTSKQFWLFSDGTWIINRTEIINNYNIKFVLNKPYIPLTALLASVNSFMVSPTSTPQNDFIPLNGTLIGTGPYLYDVWNKDYNLVLSSNPNYWGGKPQIDKLIFKDYVTPEDKFEALISGELSMLSGYNEIHSHGHYWDSLGIYDNDVLNTFMNDPDIIVEEGPSATYFEYLLMNNELINATMRKAISYACNYSAYIDKWLSGHGMRLRSPIPEGILYSNSTGIDVPYYNISIARQTLKEVNWNGLASALPADDNISAGNEWEQLIIDGTPLATYNFTYISGMLNGIVFLNITKENLRQIGVKVEAVPLSPGEYIQIFWETPPYHLNMIELSHMGYITRFNDPCSIINILCSNKALDLNYCQINDTLVQQWMEEALGETNEAIREQLYYQIQKRLIEEVFPMCYLIARNCFKIYRSNLKDFEFNHFNPVYKDIYFI
ncbi:MAG: ABC transporter substrate-binding protein, partial [Candidatus Heimdallarchaeota archaeon]